MRVCMLLPLPQGEPERALARSYRAIQAVAVANTPISRQYRGQVLNVLLTRGKVHLNCCRSTAARAIAAKPAAAAACCCCCRNYQSPN